MLGARRCKSMITSLYWWSAHLPVVASVPHYPPLQVVTSVPACGGGRCRGGSMATWELLPGPGRTLIAAGAGWMDKLLLMCCLQMYVWLLFVGSSGQWRHTPPIAVHNGCFVESGGTVPDFRSLWKSLSVVTHLSKMILCFRVIPRMFFGKIQKICYEHWKWNVKVAVGPWLVATICWCLYSCTTATTGHSN